MPSTRVDTASAPAAIGPYSQAVRSGDLLFASGQIALDPATGAIVPGGVAEQTARVFANLAAVLAAAGLTPAHVVKTTVYLKDLADFATVNQLYAGFFAESAAPPPARSTVEVARLPKDALIEIDLIAVAH